MQTGYNQMLAQLNAAVAHANDISQSASAVEDVLRAHKEALIDWRESMGGTFSGLRNELARAESGFKDAVTGLVDDLDKALILIEGKIAETAPEQPSELKAAKMTWDPPHPGEPLVDDSSLDGETHGQE